MPEKRPDHPSDNEKIDIFVSKIYPYNDEEHPNVRVLFGSYDYNGNPMPIMQIRDANTGELLTEFNPDYISGGHVFYGDNPPQPPYEEGDIWHSPDGLKIAVISRESGDADIEDWILYRDGYKVAKNYISIDEQSGIVVSEAASWFSNPEKVRVWTSVAVTDTGTGDTVQSHPVPPYDAGELWVIPTGTFVQTIEGTATSYDFPSKIAICTTGKGIGGEFAVGDWSDYPDCLVGNTQMDATGVKIRRGLDVKVSVDESSFNIFSNESTLTMGVDENDEPHLTLSTRNDYIDLTSDSLKLKGGDSIATMSSSSFNIAQLQSQSIGFYNVAYRNPAKPTALSIIGLERRSNGHLSMKRWDTALPLKEVTYSGSGSGLSAITINLPNDTLNLPVTSISWQGAGGGVEPRLINDGVQYDVDGEGHDNDHVLFTNETLTIVLGSKMTASYRGIRSSGAPSATVSNNTDVTVTWIVRFNSQRYSINDFVVNSGWISQYYSSILSSGSGGVFFHRLSLYSILGGQQAPYTMMFTRSYIGGSDYIIVQLKFTAASAVTGEQVESLLSNSMVEVVFRDSSKRRNVIQLSNLPTMPTAVDATAFTFTTKHDLVSSKSNPMNASIACMVPDFGGE